MILPRASHPGSKATIPMDSKSYKIYTRLVRRARQICILPYMKRAWYVFCQAERSGDCNVMIFTCSFGPMAGLKHKTNTHYITAFGVIRINWILLLLALVNSNWITIFLLTESYNRWGVMVIPYKHQIHPGILKARRVHPIEKKEARSSKRLFPTW